MEAVAEKNVTVVIPAFNEGRTIGPLVADIVKRHPGFEVLVIDDGSSDETSDEAVRAGATVYRHPYNIGNGAAIKSGIRRARGDILVFMDGDGQHRPEEIAALLSAFPRYDMVVGARHNKRRGSWVRATGNTVYNWLASYVAKFAVQDLTSGFRAVKADVARQFVSLLPNTYSYPTTLTLAVLRTGRSVRYVPISIRQRASGKSQIRVVRDGVRFFMIIIRICTLYSPMRVFLPVSALMVALGLANYVYTYITQGRFTNMSALMFIAGILVFMMSLISEQVCHLWGGQAQAHDLREMERRAGDRSVQGPP